MELKRHQLLVKMTVLEDEYKRTRTELASKLATKREKGLKLNWKTSKGLVFGYDKG